MTSEGTSTPSPKRRPVELVGKLFDGRVRLERLSTTQNISARTFIQGKLIRKSTRETTIGAATVAARKWYETLLARHRLGENIHGPTFADIAKKFLVHADREAVVSDGQRRNYHDKWSVLQPHFDGIKIKDIDARFLLELRRTRAASVTKLGTPITPATLKKDFAFISLVMRHGKEMEKCITGLPAFPSFGGTFSISKHGRPFLDEQQYKILHQRAKARATEPGLNPRTQRQRQELYGFILLSVGAALRVGEAYSIRWCDCELVMLKRPDGTEEEVVKMEVLGKHSKQGKRELAYAMFGGVYAFKEMRKAHPNAKPTDLVFQENHREGIKELLKLCNLRVDKKTGRTRDAKSLRPTGISLRLEKGDNVDYRDIARWCRSSPQMILAFYDQNHPEKSVERLLTFRKPNTSTAQKRTGRSTKRKNARAAHDTSSHVASQDESVTADASDVADISSSVSVSPSEPVSIGHEVAASESLFDDADWIGDWQKLHPHYNEQLAVYQERVRKRAQAAVSRLMRRALRGRKGLTREDVFGVDLGVDEAITIENDGDVLRFADRNEHSLLYRAIHILGLNPHKIAQNIIVALKKVPMPKRLQKASAALEIASEAAERQDAAETHDDVTASIKRLREVSKRTRRPLKKL